MGLVGGSVFGDSRYGFGVFGFLGGFLPDRDAWQRIALALGARAG